jgi:hypothetical protein
MARDVPASPESAQVNSLASANRIGPKGEANLSQCQPQKFRDFGLGALLGFLDNFAEPVC